MAQQWSRWRSGGNVPVDMGLRSLCYDELRDMDEAGVFTAALRRLLRVATYQAALSRRSILITCRG
jgi:hypothetical protein